MVATDYCVRGHAGGGEAFKAQRTHGGKSRTEPSRPTAPYAMLRNNTAARSLAETGFSTKYIYTKLFALRFCFFGNSLNAPECRGGGDSFVGEKSMRKFVWVQSSLLGNYADDGCVLYAESSWRGYFKTN